MDEVALAKLKMGTVEKEGLPLLRMNVKIFVETDLKSTLPLPFEMTETSKMETADLRSER